MMMNKKTAAIVACSLLFVSCSKKSPPKPEQEPASGPVLVEIKAEAQQHVGLKVEIAAMKRISEYLQVTGSVQPIDSRVAQVRSLGRGRLQRILAKVGDRVASGQALAEIDNVEAGELLAQRESARAELRRYQIQMASQAKQMERTSRLVAIGAAAQKELDLAQSEQQGLQQSMRSQESVVAGIEARLRRFGAEQGASRGPVLTTLRAPFAGVVTKAQAAAGEIADADRDLFTVADLSEVWVQAEVYEKDLGRIRIGQIAFITVDTYPDAKMAGRVAYVSDVLDPQTRTAKVRCELPNPGFRLKLDMFASVRVPTTFSKDALVVPLGALQQFEDKSVVFIQKGVTSFEMRPVKTGNTVNEQLEIVSGLKEGEKVVTQGAFHLKSIAAGKGLGEE